MPKTTSTIKNKMNEITSNGTTSPYVSTSTSDLVLGSSNLITSTNSNSITISSGSISTWIVEPTKKSKKEAVQDIMGGELEIDSLVEANQTERYEITEITFKDKKTKFVCEKQIDLDYMERLESQSLLLVEFYSMQTKQHKKTAIEHCDDLTIHSIGTSQISALMGGAGIVTGTPNGLTWTYSPDNLTFGSSTTTLLDTAGTCSYSTNITYV